MSRRRIVGVLGMLAVVGLTLTLTGCLSRGYVDLAYSSHGHDPAWLYGHGFRLGPAHFTPVYRTSGHGRGYYFRSRYLGPGRYCSRYCFGRRGQHYHHASCGHLGGYVNHYGYRVGYLIDRYGPRGYR